MNHHHYEEIDAKIVETIRAGNRRTRVIVPLVRETIEAVGARYGFDTAGYAAISVVEKRLQALRKSGTLIYYSPRGWRVVDGEVEKLRAELDDARVRRREGRVVDGKGANS
jgi:hypothetical protein